MKIEEDNCFVRYCANSDKEYAYLTHFREVWENGYSVDGYIIGTDDIYFEGASYHGFDPNKNHDGTYIMKKQYLRWTKQIQQAKETAVKMLQQTTSPINLSIEEGDFIFYTWIDDEEEEELASIARLLMLKRPQSGCTAINSWWECVQKRTSMQLWKAI